MFLFLIIKKAKLCTCVLVCTLKRYGLMLSLLFLTQTHTQTHTRHTMSSRPLFVFTYLRKTYIDHNKRNHSQKKKRLTQEKLYCVYKIVFKLVSQTRDRTHKLGKHIIIFSTWPHTIIKIIPYLFYVYVCCYSDVIHNKSYSLFKS